MNGNIGYQGQGRARLENCSISALPLLQYGGVLIFIVPSHVLDAELVGWLTRHFADLRIYRAVETQFKPVVIFGRRVRQRDQASSRSKPCGLLLQIRTRRRRSRELPLEWPFLPYTVPASPAELEHFYRVTMGPSSSPMKSAGWDSGRRSIRTWAPRSGRCVRPRGPAVALASRPGSGRRRDLRRGQVQDRARARRQR